MPDNVSAGLVPSPTPARRAPLVAIVGNPNAGKTTLFNALTGLRQRTGNYPGVTVFKKSGFIELPSIGRVEMLDLPGLYSLAASSPDEQVVMDALEGRLAGLPRPDAILCVVDSTNLLRNLFLASQVAELGLPVAMALNQTDVVRRRGMEIDIAKMSSRLGGIPVAAVSAWKREGLEAVRGIVGTALTERRLMRRIAWRPCVSEALDILRTGIEKETGRPSPDDATLQRLLFDSNTVRTNFAVPPCATGTGDGPPGAESPGQCDGRAHGRGLSPEVCDRLRRAARERVRHGGLNPFAAEAVLHYEHISVVLDGVATENVSTRERTRMLDSLLLHRAAGPAIFLLLMAVVFAGVFWVAPIPQGWIESLFEWLGALAGPFFKEFPMLQSLVVDGAIAGVGAFAVFLPQILILFFFIALLEDSGYMARAAFLMDRLFSWCGLNGRAFMPMLSGYACGVPGILATRTIEDPKARAATAFLVPFMSCSARLPVYTLMVSAFIVPSLGKAGGVLSMMAMYLLGVVVALPTAFLLTRVFLRTPPQPFVLELPRYQLPALRDILVRMWDSASEFLKRAATVIFSIVVIVWALLYFPHSEEVAQSARTAYIARHANGIGKGAAEAEDLIKAATRENFVAARARDTGKSAMEIEAEIAENDGENPVAEALAAFTAPASGLENAIAAAHVENSYLGRFGKFVQPLFAPAGYDWRITVGILASFPAREAIVATLGTTHSLGGGADAGSEDLREALRKAVWTEGARLGKPVYTLPVAFGLMAFFALCSQCGATLAVIRKESGLRWAIASFLYMTTLAWLAATACFQVGTRFF
ncbi:MAG: ferrous iron transporter B [Puniceicoccales bacterium]|jgi:ferrous iron transport protein B|nr:ferrous iron transporter B [Puniceicoccales bacterium]